VVADEVVRLVKALGGLNRYRFANDPDLLAQWESASSVVAGRRAPAETPAGEVPGAGDVRPAA
jgi:hypothetical protein